VERSPDETLAEREGVLEGRLARAERNLQCAQDIVATIHRRLNAVRVVRREVLNEQLEIERGRGSKAPDAVRDAIRTTAGKPFTGEELATGIDEPSLGPKEVRKIVARMARRGDPLIELVEEGSGRRPAKYRAGSAALSASRAGLA